MSTSTMDTAQLPVAVVVAPVDVPEWPAPVRPSTAADPRGRRALREARRKERRARRLVAAGGLAVLAAFLSATVVVVGVVR